MEQCCFLNRKCADCQKLECLLFIPSCLIYYRYFLHRPFFALPPLSPQEPTSNILVTSFQKKKKNKENINYGATQFTSGNFYLAPLFFLHIYFIFVLYFFIFVRYLFLHISLQSAFFIFILCIQPAKNSIHFMLATFCIFLSDPGKPGVRSLGLDVRHKQTN